MNELRLTVNGEPRKADPGTTVAALLRTMGIDPARVAVETTRRGPRATWAAGWRRRQDRDRRLHWRRLGRRLRATTTPWCGQGGSSVALLIGTGKYRTLEEGAWRFCLGAEIVTVALHGST
jgi:thiazole synthase